DARGNGQYLAESMMLLYGENIKQVMLSPKWYLENMPRFKAHFEDKTLLAPKDADVLSDLRSIKMDKGFAKVPDDAVVKGSDGLMRHGDSAIALALGVFASIQEVEIFAYEPVKQTAHDPNRIIASHEFKGAAGRWR
ncbi:MAG: hypothetical protein GY862_21905, partial [Gammaproteobacteria bacterium]|nr:hypothetical protein [Gammaproteobacteria bacterium]